MKAFIGKVVSAKQNKTVVVEVERLFTHPLYEKRMKRSKRYPVHDEIGAREGDMVRFVEGRPLSKTKKWQISEVLKK